jgi:oligopeptidase A
VSPQNPLLPAAFPLPFDTVRPEHVRPALSSLIAAARDSIQAIASAPGPRTWANTMAALDDASTPLDVAVSVVRHLENVVTTPELRDAWNDVQPEVSEFYSSVPLHAGLWSAIKSYAATDEAHGLTGVRARFLEKTIEGFRRHGADLDDAGKKELAALDVELATVTNKFGQNVVDATAAFEYWIDREEDLAGLPPSARAAARQAAEAKGRPGWRFTLQAPSYTAVMTYLDDAEVRRKFYHAHHRRAVEENTPLIVRILELRRRKAALLGYAHFADFVLADRMAKTGAAAQAFVASLREKTQAAFERENAALLQFRRSAEGAQARLDPWDISYWAERQRAAGYAFEEEDLRPYFPLDSVISGLFEIAGRLFGIRVVPSSPVPVWHAEVIPYEIRDLDGTLLATFYADWFPRDSKRGGAWMDAFYTGHPGEPHVGLVCGNLTPPLAGQPALLTHREVETIFHEFGHLLHHALSRVEVRSLAGTNVAWDFVELPSQIMENWCWERESLDLFARHWQTGEPIPEELFRKMRRARTFRGANVQMRQLGFGTVDLALHVEYEPDAAPDPLAWANPILAAFFPAPLPPDYAMLAAFTHLFADPDGYGAAYYSYKWAEVLDADAFTRFQAEGIFSSVTGRAFRETILAAGNSEDPAVLFRRFLGRDPDARALLERLGLTSS